MLELSGLVPRKRSTSTGSTPLLLSCSCWTQARTSVAAFASKEVFPQPCSPQKIRGTGMGDLR